MINFFIKKITIHISMTQPSEHYPTHKHDPALQHYPTHKDLAF